MNRFATRELSMLVALVAIWAVLQAVGLDVMEWIRAQLQV